MPLLEFMYVNPLYWLGFILTLVVSKDSLIFSFVKALSKFLVSLNPPDLGWKGGLTFFEAKSSQLKFLNQG
jgi:hypothetical protein